MSAIASAAAASSSNTRENMRGVVAIDVSQPPGQSSSQRISQQNNLLVRVKSKKINKEVRRYGAVRKVLLVLKIFEFHLKIHRC
ncbi:hypothetical protein GUJ93_ZPchr2169g6439 [Zizania palustris]|uniref:Uncharacterized protein n=1 Tax=Zizania palustris TaxID=103762 RepID=A0A8J5UUG7_ZIZPA|nr:hypothetical protein GUJ93_ZPchr2169g6439 [Zizania palustris]